MYLVSDGQGEKRQIYQIIKEESHGTVRSRILPFHENGPGESPYRVIPGVVVRKPALRGS